MPADPVELGRAVSMLRTLANPTRLRIVLHLLQGEAAVSQIEQALGLRQPNLSQQLAELREAGIVFARREAKSAIYALHGAAARELAETLGRIFVPGTPIAETAPLAPNRAAPGLGGTGATPRLSVSTRPRQAAVFATVGDNSCQASPVTSLPSGAGC